MAVRITHAAARRELEELIRRQVHLAAGKDGWVSRRDQERLHGFVGNAAGAMRSRPGARIRSQALIDFTVERAMDTWEAVNPPSEPTGRYLSKSEVREISSRRPTLGPLTLRAWQNARALAVPPRVPTDRLRLPDVRQDTVYTCGPSALLAILAYYDVYEWSEADLAKECGADPFWGTDPEDLMRVARKYGIEVEERRGMTLDDLERCLAAGEPVLVTYQAWQYDDYQIPWERDWDDGHYSIVVGMDEHYVYFEDPSLIGELGAIPRREFLDRWHDVDRAGNRLWQHGLIFRGPRPPDGEGRVERIR